MTRNLSADHIAALISTDARTVKRWCRESPPCPHSRRGKRKQVFFDESEVREWMRVNNKTGKPGRPPEITPGDYEKLGGDKKWWDAVNAKLKALRTQGKLVETAMVEKFIVDLIAIAKQKFLNLGTRLSPSLEGRDSAERQEILDGAIYEILNELAVTRIPLPEQLDATTEIKAQRVGGKKLLPREVGK